MHVCSEALCIKEVRGNPKGDPNRKPCCCLVLALKLSKSWRLLLKLLVSFFPIQIADGACGGNANAKHCPFPPVVNVWQAKRSGNSPKAFFNVQEAVSGEV